MDIQLIRLDRFTTIFHIHRLRGLIKLVLAIKKQHQLVMMMSRQFRAHLSKFRVLLLIRCCIILDHQCSMCNSRWGKFRIKCLILAHQARYRYRLKEQRLQFKGFIEIQILISITRDFKQQTSKGPSRQRFHKGIIMAQIITVEEPPKLQGPHAPVTIQRPLTTMHRFLIT